MTPREYLCYFIAQYPELMEEDQKFHWTVITALLRGYAEREFPKRAESVLDLHGALYFPNQFGTYLNASTAKYEIVVDVQMLDDYLVWCHENSTESYAFAKALVEGSSNSRPVLETMVVVYRIEPDKNEQI